MEKLRLAVLISGGGSNLQALIDACKSPSFPARIALVISNVPEAPGLERARKAMIPAVTVNHKDFDSREAFEDALQSVLRQYPVDLVCLAGFTRILTEGFVNAWVGRIINTHPSLLPRHGGPGMHGLHVHRAVLEAGDAESGASIHYVIPECDRGPVIVQRRVPVLPGDTPELLAARVIEQEHIAYPQAVRMIAEGLEFSSQIAFTEGQEKTAMSHHAPAPVDPKDLEDRLHVWHTFLKIAKWHVIGIALLLTGMAAFLL